MTFEIQTENCLFLKAKPVIFFSKISLHTIKHRTPSLPLSLLSSNLLQLCRLLALFQTHSVLSCPVPRLFTGVLQTMTGLHSICLLASWENATYCFQVFSQLSLCVHLTLWGPMNCSPPGSSVHGIFQARLLEWVAISSFRGSSQPRHQTCVSCISCVGKYLPLAPPQVEIIEQYLKSPTLSVFLHCLLVG